jgi:putative Mn2+ efflux pump MntP
MNPLPPALLIPLIGSLSLDTFAVSLAVGIAPLPRSTRMRFAAACAGAETVMPLVGFALGGLATRLGDFATWLGAVVVLGAGILMIREALENEDELEEAVERAALGGPAMLLVALSVSMDELAVGVALGAFRLPLVPVIAAIAAQAFVASLLGLRLGSALGERIGRRAGLLAGLSLCAVAAWLAAGKVAGWI